MIDKIKLEILESSYWEHFKYAKDLDFILPLDNPKRKLIQSEVNKLANEITILKQKIK